MPLFDSVPTVGTLSYWEMVSVEKDCEFRRTIERTYWYAVEKRRNEGRPWIFYRSETGACDSAYNEAFAGIPETGELWGPQVVPPLSLTQYHSHCTPIDVRHQFLEGPVGSKDLSVLRVQMLLEWAVRIQDPKLAAAAARFLGLDQKDTVQEAAETKMLQRDLPQWIVPFAADVMTKNRKWSKDRFFRLQVISASERQTIRLLAAPASIDERICEEQKVCPQYGRMQL